MSWQSDYVFVLNADDTTGDLTAWVTLHNNTGAAYENAKLKLVAGNVQRVATGGYYGGYPQGTASAAPAAPPPPRFQEEGFFEYHLYTLSQPTNLLQNEQKQVTLLDGAGIKVNKKLIFFGQPYYYRGQYGQVMSNQKVGVYLDIENKEANHLGMAMPKGVVRVYKADKSGSKQFIGEDRIDHTPRDEKLRIKMGEAFDVVGERKQTSYRSLSTCSSETSWEILLKNHKDQAADVEDVEPIGGDWTMEKESHPHTKKDAHTFVFNVKVPGRGEVKIAYTVRIRWC
jgi:hypothetical protein